MPKRIIKRRIFHLGKKKMSNAIFERLKWLFYVVCVSTHTKNMIMKQETDMRWWEHSSPLLPRKEIIVHLYRASLVAQMVKNLSAMQETQVLSLGREEPLEEGMASHSRILAWRIPWTEEPGGLHTVCGVAKSRARRSNKALSVFHSLKQETHWSWKNWD